jgi:hypothetical protein
VQKKRVIAAVNNLISTQCHLRAGGDPFPDQVCIKLKKSGMQAALLKKLC